MSVLIKTMTNLPEHCYDCPCHNGESGYCQADKEQRYSIDRPFWCPLIEIRQESEETEVESQKSESKHYANLAKSFAKGLQMGLLTESEEEK